MLVRFSRSDRDWGRLGALPVFENNRALLDAFRAGERHALETVYRRYFSEIVGIAKHGFTLEGTRLAGMPNPDDQLDLAQEVFIKAFAEPARLSFDGIRPYGPFLRRIARNAMIDRARRSGREVPASFDDSDVLGDPPSETPTIDEDLHFERLRAETEAYLAGQSDEVRRFVHLRFVDGRSQAEVAADMGVTRRRVRTLEGLAMDGLGKHMKKRGLSW